MTSQFRFYLMAAIVLLAMTSSRWSDSLTLEAAPADKKEIEQPVEADMHEFMEYVFEPTFKRLKPAMAAAPTDNQGWKAIKADALILAESGNLLLIRQPEDDPADWVNHSVEVRKFGGQLYRAAKTKDYSTARKHYESMVQHCNACHQQFAGGEHMLEP